MLVICGAICLLPLHPTSAPAQENEYPAMEPPPDYVEQLHERERNACINAGGCDLPVAPGRPANPDMWTALAMSDTTKRYASSHGQYSKQAAMDLAVSNCRRTGSLDCKVLLWAGNQCLALAGSRDGASGWDVDPDRAQAGLKAMARCRSVGGKYCVVDTAPCAGDDPRWASPLPLPPQPANTVPLDPRAVGTWTILINPGRWYWRVARNGSYEFHSEAGDGVGSHAGTFSARDGHWTLNATNGYSDQGSYTFPDPGSFATTGQHGSGTWHRVGQ
jgi:hypothetical protein